MSQLAAIIFCALTAALAAFQVALIAGAPIGNFAWGGQHRVLPPPLRIGSAVSLAIYAAFATIVLQAAGLLAWLPQPVAYIGIWVITAYMALGIVMNAISRSRPERLTMTPVAATLFASALVVALA